MDHYTRGDLRFEVADRGPEDADAVVLLHGWPEDSSSWDEVVPHLTRAGLRTLAPDQRGYSPGARPPGRRSYAGDELVGDVLALADAASLDRFHVVGHDWGGAVAWALAAGHPGRVASLTVLSTPHPRAMARSMLGTQLLRSWYMGFFQLPVVPEALLLARGGAVLANVLERSGLPPERAAVYVARQRQPGALSASLGWYRGVLTGSAAGADRPIAVPTTYAWSTGDTALGRQAAERTGDHVTGPYRFEILDGVSHWIPEEAPDLVAELVLDRVGRTAGA
ncbi:MAG: putative hydrolase or acyltransferase of alpha/beta superfamily [Acidimicrobiales bacterium]|nr:putative hydrolase or acyltransferase of alpha/beta superfamily [Acidimicrobiales bacterium]